MKWLRNGLAVIGALSILSVAAVLTWTYFPSTCQVSLLETSSANDKSVKATVYRTECGAAAATRTLVALSNEKVDGSKNGETILTLLGNAGSNAGTVAIPWQDNRHLLVEYPEVTNIEYAVAKTRGITVELRSK
jgi:hypothetical protein